MMELNRLVSNLVQATALARDVSANANIRTLASMLGPAFRGLVLQRGKDEDLTALHVGYPAAFDWRYRRDLPAMARLYEVAKVSQWNAATDIEWSRTVVMDDPARPLLPDSFLPFADLPSFRGAPPAERNKQVHALLAWLLSQFLHGEQGALFAAAQVTEAVPWLDAKLYGSTQVVDEGRHVEVFHTYLTQKLGKLYEINDNLYVIIDALMSDRRWDVKFLGMQIMIEGLALGAFGTIRKLTGDPLLKDLLKYVITDEARHVHYGVLALGEFYRREVSEKERREREDWAFEVALLLRNRFLAHEFYDEYYAHVMSRARWDDVVRNSGMMTFFRQTMFKRIVPNLKRIGLLSERVRAHYAQAGLLDFEHGKAAPDLTVEDLLNDG